MTKKDIGHRIETTGRIWFWTTTIFDYLAILEKLGVVAPQRSTPTSRAESTTRGSGRDRACGDQGRPAAEAI